MSFQENLKQKISNLPEGELCIYQSPSYQKWICSLPGKQKYLSKKNQPLAEALALKKYYSLLLAEAEEELTLEQAAQRALELTRNGYAASAAAKAAAQGTPYSKSEVYKQLLVLQAD